MGTQGVHLEGYAHTVKESRSLADYGKVTGAPHDDTNKRLHNSLYIVVK